MTVPRIAMWSGPRNISTAMMRSFDSRSDSFVADEPLYAAYLAATGLNHPGREVILREQETNWRRVVNMLLADPPDGATVYYQKHMAHHLTPDVELGWIDELCNVFLIREPAAMLVSLQRVIDEPSAEQTGLPQQVALLEHLQTRGKSVPVLLANDVLADPAGMLSQVCAHAKIPFDRHMLHWEAGSRSTDGVWAPWWYANVEASTGFGPPRYETPDVPASLRGVLAECEDAFNQLAEHRLLPVTSRTADAPDV